MRQDELHQHQRQSGLDWSFVWFIRLVALVALVSGVYYWIRLMGVFSGLLWRFDLMPWMWQTATVALALLLPVAATGLWMRAAWGPLLWIIAAVGEISIYSVFARYFEYRPLIVALNVFFIAIYVVFRVLLYLEKKRQIRIASEKPI